MIKILKYIKLILIMWSKYKKVKKEVKGMFNLKQGIWKAVRSILLVAIPVIVVYLNAQGLGGKTIIELIVQVFPILGSLTLSGLLLLIRDWIKHRK